MAVPIPTPVLGRSNAPGTTFPMSPLSSLGHVNLEFVARYGPALHPTNSPRRGRAFDSCQPAHYLLHAMQALSQLSYGPLNLPRGLGGAGQKP
jgi:hypothetical protein